MVQTPHTSQGCPGFDHAGIGVAHLAGFLQLAEAEAHEEHGIDAAQHPCQLLLVSLRQGFQAWISKSD